MKNLSPFTRMVICAVSGALLGIAFGLALGLLINWISIHLTTDPGFSQNPVGAFFGMGAGAIIGSILGGVNANRK